jgi:uncharacterized protein YciI
MPTFVLIGRDRPGHLALRMAQRGSHLEGLEALDRRGALRHAGPLLDGSGDPMGSVVIFDAEDLGAARRLVEDDAYVQHGLFEHYEVHETKVVFPR